MLFLWQYNNGVPLSTISDDDIIRIDQSVIGQPTPYETNFITFGTFKSFIGGGTVPVPTIDEQILIGKNTGSYVLLAPGNEGEFLGIRSGLASWGTSVGSATAIADQTIFKMILEGSLNWEFQQNGTGASAGLRLRSISDKNFFIDANNTILRDSTGATTYLTVNSTSIILNRKSTFTDEIKPASLVSASVTNNSLYEESNTIKYKNALGTVYDLASGGGVGTDPTFNSVIFNTTGTPATNRTIFDSGTYLNYRDGTGLVTTMLSSRAGEFSAYALKGTPVGADRILIEDSASSFSKAYTTIAAIGGGGGVATFLDLSDTPSNYTGDAFKLVYVGSGETDLQFTNSPFVNSVIYNPLASSPGSVLTWVDSGDTRLKYTVGVGNTKSLAYTDELGLTIQDEGTPLSTLGTTLNFVGSGVTASGTGATKTITITGGGAASFLDLTDTPSSYSSLVGAFAVTNATATGLEFTQNPNAIFYGFALQSSITSGLPALWVDLSGNIKYYNTVTTKGLALSDTASIFTLTTSGGGTNFLADDGTYKAAGSATSKSLLTFRFSNNNANTTVYYGSNAGSSTDETFVQFAMPFNCTIKNLYVVCNSFTLDSGNSVTTLRLNGLDTILTTTTTTTGTVSDTSNSVTVTAGDLINIKVVTGGTTGVTSFSGITVMLEA